MAIPLTGINMAKGSPKVAIDDDVMDYVSGGCGQCESQNSYKRFMLAAAIVTGYGADLKSLDLLIRAYMASLNPNGATGCTDSDGPNGAAAMYQAYSHV